MSLGSLHDSCALSYVVLLLLLPIVENERPSLFNREPCRPVKLLLSIPSFTRDDLHAQQLLTVLIVPMERSLLAALDE